MVVPPAGLNITLPVTSQSPAVREILVTFAAALADRLTPVTLEVTYSPTLPAVALLALLTPTIFGVVIVGDEDVTEFASTKAVVASCVVLVARLAVGAVGVPVSEGDASGA
jgi:hypothetical protein